jgi:hypothetical protein
MCPRAAPRTSQVLLMSIAHCTLSADVLIKSLSCILPRGERAGDAHVGRNGQR